MNRLWIVLVALAVIVGGSSAAYGQGSFFASLSGTVVDSSGALIPGRKTMIGATPPKSVKWRSSTFSAMPAATPASMALPPRGNMRSPASEAR